MKLSEVKDPKIDEYFQWLSSHWDKPSRRVRDFMPVDEFAKTKLTKSWMSLNENRLDYKGNIRLSNVHEIQVPFGVVQGSVTISGHFTSLKNFPIKVNNVVEINSFELTSLKHIPEHISGTLTINSKKLNELDAWPKYVGFDINLHANLSSIKGIHKIISKVSSGKLSLSGNPIEGSILDAMRIDGVKNIIYVNIDQKYENLEKAFKIINKYLGQGNAGIIKAQRELIENDLEDYS